MLPTVKSSPRSHLLAWVVGGVVLALFVGGVVLLWQSGQSEEDDGQIDFTLASLDGEAVRLSDFRGQVVLVNFWASWCPPCRAEMPALNRLYTEHAADGLVVLAVNTGEDFHTASQFIQANGFTLPVALDPDQTISNLLNVRGLPTSLFIQRDGTIARTWPGRITLEQAEAILAPLLAQSTTQSAAPHTRSWYVVGIQSVNANETTATAAPSKKGIAGSKVCHIHPPAMGMATAAT